MAFSPDDKLQLLRLKGIGPKVIERLEQLGINCWVDLAAANPPQLLQRMAAMAGSKCWHNNPDSLSSIERAVRLAQQQLKQQNAQSATDKVSS